MQFWCSESYEEIGVKCQNIFNIMYSTVSTE